MPSPPGTLPILERRAEIEDAVRTHQVVVVCGETGSGKTTQLPQILFELANSSTSATPRRHPGIIGHTQPRRLAARAVAARIAEERSEKLGGPNPGLVGVKVRFQDQTTPRTAIKVMTDGILLAELASDPQLRAYSTIIIDEAHERSLNIDFLLGYLKLLLPKRPDLRLIITSATIDTRRFSDHFGGPFIAPVIEVSGRMFPVETRYRPTSSSDERTDFINVESIADAVEELLIISGPPGDTLVFLPGEREIRLAGDAIARRQLNLQVLPLFSRLTNDEQDRIFHRNLDGQPRVILATNVAETSLTVPGIRFVIDTGLARLSRYDPSRKIQSLPIEPISRASANQRSGRCGRVAAGVCVRLYSKDSFDARPAFTDPEIRRTNLASVILRMKGLGRELGNIETFPFLDPPDPRAIQDGYETLFELGAISEASPEGKLTKIGATLAQVPLDPRIARMLLAAEHEQSLNELIALSAVLSIQDPRERPMSRQDDADRAQSVFRHESSDFLSLLKLWDQYTHAADSLSQGSLVAWCRDHFLSPTRMREWSETARQLADIAQELKLQRSLKLATDDAIHRALLTGLITNVACREGDGSFDYRGVRGNVVQIFPGSALFKKGPKWIMAAEVVQTTRLYARTVAKIDPDWIEQLAAHMFRRQITDPHLDADTGQPAAWERLSMSGIVVVPRRRTDLAPHDPQKSRTIFIREALAQGKWNLDAPFMRHNREAHEQARAAAARLRRRDALIDEDQLANWFKSRIPDHIAEPTAFESWRAGAEKNNPRLLTLSVEDLLRLDARHALDQTLFPDSITLGPSNQPVLCPLEFALAPGKDEDGLTITISLENLHEISTDSTQWAVPGILPDIIQALIKSLPKAQRAAINARGTLSHIATTLAESITFREGSLPRSMSEAIEILFTLHVDLTAWSFKSLPDHLRPRIRIIDHQGREIAADRDLAALQQRLQARAEKARAARERHRFERPGLTTWDFGNLPDSIETEHNGTAVVAHPALTDRGDSAALTLLASAHQARLHTNLGARRLYSIACHEEVGYYLNAHPQWKDMTKQFSLFGSERDLRDHITSIIAERTFLDGEPPLRSQSDFESRRANSWGRLSSVAREVCDTVASFLEPRARVAQRLAGGTPRLWAESIADIREHAAYLMPQGFLSLVTWEHLQNYPRYVEAMRLRLLSLREDGSQAESTSLRQFTPHWKRFTGWVAAEMSRERAAAESESASESDHESNPSSPTASNAKANSNTKANTKAPLPLARRAAAAVNLGAGEWAMQRGRLPPLIDRYRWALEELRVSLLAPGSSHDNAMTTVQLDQLWKTISREAPK